MLIIDVGQLKPRPWMVHACGAGAVGAIALAFYGWFFAPAGAEIEHSVKRMDQLQALMASSEQIAEEHRRLDLRLTALRSVASAIDKRIPSHVSSQEFIDRATRLAESLELKVELCSAAAPQTHATHTQVEVTCRLRGSYASVCRFLAAIDQITQISKVSHLEVDTAANSGEYPANVIFQLYYRGEVNDTEQKRGTLS
jgi:Tfp pilus assembly protein PilO